MLTAAWLLLTLAGCMFSSLERGLARPGRMGLQACALPSFLLAPSYFLLLTSYFLRPTFYLLLTACGGGYGGPKALVGAQF